MLTVEKKAPSVVKINKEAVKKYEDYFNYLLNHTTIELTLLNEKKYYTFSDMPFSEWKTTFTNLSGVIQATEFLDKIKTEDLSVLSIKSVKDVSREVKDQYIKQREIIFSSYEIVKKIILMHSEKKIVKDAIRIVLRSRENTESKRRYWRVLNESYYGLDIHPLMEYELDELVKILYACEHYNENPNFHVLSWVLASTAIVSGGVVIGYYLAQSL